MATSAKYGYANLETENLDELESDGLFVILAGQFPEREKESLGFEGFPGIKVEAEFYEYMVC